MKSLFFSLIFFVVIVANAQENFYNLFSQGSKKYDAENFRAAIDDFSAAIKNKQSARNEYDVAKAYLKRAYCKSALKDFKGAIQDMSEAIKLKPEYVDLYFARATFHINNREFKEAILWLDKGLVIRPNEENLLFLKSETYSKQKDYKQALFVIDSVLLKLSPTNIEALISSGGLKHTLKDNEESIKTLTKVLDLDPKNINALYNRGISKADKKDFEGALRDINLAMEIDTASRWVGLNNIAYFIKFEQQDYKGAIASFDECIKINPNFAYAFNNRGYAKMKLKDFKGAKEDIEKSLVIDPESSYSYKTYGQLLIEENKVKQACEKFKMAITLGYTLQYDDDVEDLLAKHCK